MQTVTLIGMGASADTLTAEAREALGRAELVAGAQRLLDALPAGVTAERVPAVRPADVLAAVAGAQNAAVLYSGDTGFYSGAAGLLARLKEAGIPARVLPGLSSVQMLAAAPATRWPPSAAGSRPFSSPGQGRAAPPPSARSWPPPASALCR